MRSSNEVGTHGAFQLQLLVERQEKRKLAEEVMQLRVALEETNRKALDFEQRWRTVSKEWEEMEDLFVRQSHSKQDAIRETSGLLTGELSSIQQELEVTRNALMDANDALGEERRKREAIEFDTNTSQRFIRSRYDAEIDYLQLNLEETSARGRLEKQAFWISWGIVAQLANDVTFDFSIAIKAARSTFFKESSRWEVHDERSKGEHEAQISQLQLAIGELKASVTQGDRSVLELHKALEKERSENEKLRDGITDLRGNNQVLREKLSAKTQLLSGIVDRNAVANEAESALRQKQQRQHDEGRHPERAASDRAVSPPGSIRSSSFYTPIDASILSPSKGPSSTSKRDSLDLERHEHLVVRAKDEARRLRSELAERDLEICRLTDANILHAQTVKRLQKERDTLTDDNERLTRENTSLTKSIAAVARHNPTADEERRDSSVSLIRSRYFDTSGDLASAERRTPASRVFDEAGWNQQVMVLSKDVSKLRKDNAQLKELLRLQEAQLNEAQEDSVPKELHTSEMKKWKKFVAELQQVQEELEGQLTVERQRSKKLSKRLEDAMSDPSSSSMEKLQRKNELLISEMSEVKAENATLRAMIESNSTVRVGSSSTKTRYEDGPSHHKRVSERYAKSSDRERHESYHPPVSEDEDPYFQSNVGIRQDTDAKMEMRALAERNVYLERLLERGLREDAATRHPPRMDPPRTMPQHPHAPLKWGSPTRTPIRHQEAPQKTVAEPPHRIVQPLRSEQRRYPSSPQHPRYANVTDSPPRQRALSGHSPDSTLVGHHRGPPTKIQPNTGASLTTIRTPASPSNVAVKTPVAGRRIPPSSGIDASGPPTVGITPLPPAQYHRYPGGSPDATKRLETAQPKRHTESTQHQFKPL